MYASTDGKNVELGGAGLKIIPRSTKSLVVTRDTSASSQVKVQIPWYGFLSKSIELTPSKNADKIGYLQTSRDGCATYSVRLASLLSYDCQKPTALLRYDTNERTWGPRKVSPLAFQDGLVAPYMGGVIGIEGGMHLVTRPIEVVRDDGSSVRYDLPPEVKLDTVSQAKIITNQFDTSDNRFVIIDYLGNIHLGTPSAQNKTVTYKTIPRTPGYSETYQRTLCKILGDFVYCYRGQYIRGDMPDSDAKLPAESITTASFTNDEVTTTELALPGRYSDFYVTLDGDMYGKNFKKLFYLTATNKTYQAREIAQNVDTAAGGEGLLYVQRNAIYHVKKDGDATMRFYSPNVLPSSLYVTSDAVFVIATVKDMGNNFHAYRLNDQDHLGGNRLIDLLPLGGGRLPAVTYQDVVGERAQLTLAMPISKTTRTPIDTVQFEARKQRVIDTLRSRGVDLTKVDLSFNY